MKSFEIEILSEDATPTMWFQADSAKLEYDSETDTTMVVIMKDGCEFELEFEDFIILNELKDVDVEFIDSTEEYLEALEKAYQLMDAGAGSEEENELDRLATLVEEYEDEHFPIDPPETDLK